MNLELLGIPLGFVLFYFGARLMVRGSVEIGAVRKGFSLMLIVLLLAFSITVPTFLLSLCVIDEPHIMLQDTFGAYIADIGLAIFLAVVLLNPKCARFRLEIGVVAMGVIFLTVIGFTGYLTFTESAVLQFLVALVLLVPLISGEWKEYTKDFVPEVVEASVGLPLRTAAIYWAAGFVLVLLGTFAAVLGLVDAVYEGRLLSQVVLAFFVGAMLAVMQAIPAAVGMRHGVHASAALLLVTCIYFNCLFALISVYGLPLTEI